MPVHNANIAAMFEEIADLLAVKGDNPFRIRAYRTAARTLRGLGSEVAELVKAGEDLTRLPGIGHDLAAKIEEAVRRGSLAKLRELHHELPRGLTALLDLPGLGPKRVKQLQEALGVHTPAQLRRAAEAGRVRALPGFGARTEQRLLAALEAHASRERRFPRFEVRPYAEALAAYLRAGAGVTEVVVAGSYRRACETVGDLDLLAVARDGAAVTQRFADYDEVRRVLARGPTRATAILHSGIQVDLRVVPRASFGAALHYFTGNKAHNIAVRRLGQRRGLKINEYGVFRGERRIAGRTEAEVYRSVGLPYIAPELRENRGELEAAAAGRLPRLVERADLRGDLHCHTVASDGRDSLRAMAEAARAAGLEYLAITEHSHRLTVAHGLDADRLLRHAEAIDRLNEELEGITLLKGVEVDILENGELDLPDEVLARLDLVIGAIHSAFTLPRARQTSRVLRALDHPHFTLLAHPSARLLGKRAPCDLDMERVIRAARERGCYLELNAQPERLDLDDVHARMAKAEGVLVSIDSDAHAAGQFANLDAGVAQARRAWLEPADVLTTRALPALRPLLRRTV